MSQKPDNTRLRPRVSSGVPWWLWGIILLVGGFVVANVLTRAVPVDPQAVFDKVMALSNDTKATELTKAIEELRNFPDYADHVKLLEGLLLLGRSRPVKAIKPLEEASANSKLRETALQFLGTAMAQSDNVQGAIQTFELMLKENPDAHQARESLSSLLVQRFALKEALEHISILVEKKFNLSKALQIRGEVHMELGDYAAAIADLSLSIKEGKNDPTNGQKAGKIVQCAFASDNLEKAVEFGEGADRPTLRSAVKAWSQMAKDDLAAALATIETIRTESLHDENAGVLYGRIMLKYNKPEKAKEALVSLNKQLYYSRSVRLYEVAVEVAKLAGNNELAGLIQQNLDQLQAMSKELTELLPQVAASRDGSEDRLRLAGLAANLGKTDLAMKLYRSVGVFEPERASEMEAKTEDLYRPTVQLVKTGEAPPLETMPPGAPPGFGPPDGEKASPPGDAPATKESQEQG